MKIGLYNWQISFVFGSQPESFGIQPILSMQIAMVLKFERDAFIMRIFVYFKANVGIVNDKYFQGQIQ